MTDSSDALDPHVETTAEIVAAYVSRNSVPTTGLPNLIRSVHASLASLGAPVRVEPADMPLSPAVPVRRSVTDEYIISLEDGRKFKSMKRYLSGLGMTPADYRAKWGLPSDYPMVAPAYAAKRSALAKNIGLGRKGTDAAFTVPAAALSPPPSDVAVETTDVAAKKPRRRPSKAD